MLVRIVCSRLGDKNILVGGRLCLDPVDHILWRIKNENVPWYPYDGICKWSCGYSMWQKQWWNKDTEKHF